MYSFQTGEMIQWIKVLVAKPDGQSLILEPTHIVVGENQLFKVFMAYACTK